MILEKKKTLDLNFVINVLLSQKMQRRTLAEQCPPVAYGKWKVKMTLIERLKLEFFLSCTSNLCYMYRF